MTKRQDLRAKLVAVSDTTGAAISVTPKKSAKKKASSNSKRKSLVQEKVIKNGESSVEAKPKKKSKRKSQGIEQSRFKV